MTIQKQELSMVTMFVNGSEGNEQTRIVYGDHCLLMDRKEMSNLNRGPFINASYQVSVQLAKVFQRRRLKCEKLTDDEQQMPSDGKSSHFGQVS